LLPIATSEQRESSKKIGDKVASLEKKWRDNKNNDEGKNALKDMLKALNELKGSGFSAEPNSIPANVPTMEEVGIGEPVRELFLVIPDDLAAEKIRQAGKGRSLAFFNDVFVEGVVEKVAGFH
jgi:hypothetical protein